MSEIKGQLLGIILVVTIFSAVAGVLLTAFISAANSTSAKISEEPNIVQKAQAYKTNTDLLVY